MKKQKLSIYCDGGARGNPGPASSAFVVFDEKKKLYSDSKYLGKATNNIAEYNAVIIALDWIVKSKYKSNVERVDFYLDSELVVKQLTGIYKIKSQNLKPLITKIKLLEKNIDGKIFFHYIPRTKNKIADKLVNESLDENL